MNKRPTLKEFKERSLQDASFREEYEALRPEFELIKEFIRARKKTKLSQRAHKKRV
jgi:hypothetical protein